jgi:hypothetical protein
MVGCDVDGKLDGEVEGEVGEVEVVSFCGG